MTRKFLLENHDYLIASRLLVGLIGLLVKKRNESNLDGIVGDGEKKQLFCNIYPSLQLYLNTRAV